MTSAIDTDGVRRQPAVEICASAALIEGGPGVRFDLRRDLGNRWVDATAFVVRHDGVIRGYLNECRHVPSELDWTPGRYFDSSGLYLICATHGALYRPHDGLCVAGPCVGRRLFAVEVYEHDGLVWWIPDSQLRPFQHQP